MISEEAVLKDNNFIFIGKKSLRDYLNTIKFQLNSQDKSEIVIKARGKFISKAVDVTEVVKRSDDINLKVNDIKIGTEEYKDENQFGNVKVSTIEISLMRSN